MTRKNINRLIGYGILTFMAGIILGLSVSKYFQFFIILGSLSSFLGTYYFFKTVNLREEFRKNPKDDILTYFWNAIVFKFWTFTFLIMMIMSIIFILRVGFIE